MSQFRESLDRLEPQCPYCDNCRDLERRGAFWFCPCCSREFSALSEMDKKLLHALRVDPKE